MNATNFPAKRILVFGDSNTFGYDPETDGRYSDTERYPRILEQQLGSNWTVLEAGLPGRTAVFDDPLTEGMNGLNYITPCLMSHAPLDSLVIMLGTNDCKARFGCGADLIARGILRLAAKAANTPCWRDQADILIISPPAIRPTYRNLKFRHEMGPDCDVKSAELPAFLAPLAASNNFHFLDAEEIPSMEMSPVDGMHLTPAANQALATALAEVYASANSLI